MAPKCAKIHSVFRLDLKVLIAKIFTGNVPHLEIVASDEDSQYILKNSGELAGANDVKLEPLKP
tara:strand:+ start:111 stop:302 length:192 start_codon:yes stop_codon:yes gene_type:complete